MFHQGDLNSGITRAIQEQKVVACFIRQDDNEDCQIWEEQWLGSIPSGEGMPLGEVVGARAVLLRLDLGSQEAGFLSAFCTITKAPTLVVIRHGQVLDKLEGGLEYEEFLERLEKAVGSRSKEDVEEADVGAKASSTSAETMTDQAQTSGSAQSSQAEPSQSPGYVYANVNPEAQRLEAERVRREALEKADRIAKANARRKEAEEASAAAHKGKERQLATTEVKEKQRAKDAWIYQQKQRKDEAKKERERVLGQIESDKQERKARAAMAREGQTESGTGQYSEMGGRSGATAIRSGGSCALLIRLFDGSSIRGKFASDVDIATAVRTWVKEAAPEGGADIPYNFRQILAPHPSRSIEVSEEHQSLQDLGLLPSATLVLVPVAGYTDAYSDAGRGYIGYAYSAVNKVYSLAGSALSYIPGMNYLAANAPYMGGTGDEREESNVEGARVAESDSAAPGGSTRASTANVRVKTLFDQQAEQAARDSGKGATFYNGNSSAFEGRKDDDQDK